MPPTARMSPGPVLGSTAALPVLAAVVAAATTGLLEVVVEDVVTLEAGLVVVVEVDDVAAGVVGHELAKLWYGFVAPDLSLTDRSASELTQLRSAVLTQPSR